MAVTILYGDRPVSVASATAEGNNLWLSLDDLRATTGWERKPQGVCLGEVCIPIPVGREADFVGADGTQFNLAALVRVSAGTSRHSGEGCKSQTVKVQPTTLAPSHAGLSVTVSTKR